MRAMGRGQRIGMIVAALAVAALAFVLLSPSDSDDDDVTPTTATQTRPQEDQKKGDKPAPKPKPSFSVVRVKGGEPAGGVQRLTVRKDSTVRLEVRSDQAGEIHVHGYDLSKAVKARGAVRFTFKADIEGVFEIEVENTKTEIGQLVVEP